MGGNRVARKQTADDLVGVTPAGGASPAPTAEKQRRGCAIVEHVGNTRDGRSCGGRIERRPYGRKRFAILRQLLRRG